MREWINRLIALYEERPTGTAIASAIVGGIVGTLLVSTLSTLSLGFNIAIVLGCIGVSPTVVLLSAQLFRRASVPELAEHNHEMQHYLSPWQRFRRIVGRFRRRSASLPPPGDHPDQTGGDPPSQQLPVQARASGPMVQRARAACLRALSCACYYG
ncbi:MAG TPA: hypothetical protein VGH44_00880 [Candidatus Saccharimonadia bacterium]|jgi:hypothetical protein